MSASPSPLRTRRRSPIERAAVNTSRAGPGWARGGGRSPACQAGRMDSGQELASQLVPPCGSAGPLAAAGVRVRSASLRFGCASGATNRTPRRCRREGHVTASVRMEADERGPLHPGSPRIIACVLLGRAAVRRRRARADAGRDPRSLGAGPASARRGAGGGLPARVDADLHVVLEADVRARAVEPWERSSSQGRTPSGGGGAAHVRAHRTRANRSQANLEPA